MTTTQQQRPTIITAPSSRRIRLIVGMAVIGLLIGLLGGWLLFGTDDVISVHDAELTDRQNEMVALVDDAFDAWRANDVDRVLAHYTDTATFIAADRTYRASDGTLAQFVTSFLGASTMEDVGPDVIVDDNTVITFHTYDDKTRVDIFDVTMSGAVLIVRHEVTS